MAGRTGKRSSVRSRLLTRITLLALLVSASFAALPAVASACTNVPPEARFTYSPSSPEAAQSVSFDGSGSLPGIQAFPGPPGVDGQPLCMPLPAFISSYSWEWGDGSPATSGGPEVASSSHTFAAPGTYNVTLTVTSWTTDTETKAVTVTAAPSSGGGGGTTPPPSDGGGTPPPDGGGTTPPPSDGGGTPPPDGGGNPLPPSGGPVEYARTLSISYSEKKDAFGGKLASQAASCIAGQKVSVFEKKKGKDPKLGSWNTNVSGKYSLEEKNAEGSFYAKVGQTSTSGGTCLGAQSKAIKVG